ncbi:MFS transporter [Lichenibacterium ramalinae]|uniref:MFS transporter n=1 Tax=Lichenibacterium ramalinae TaxID=2316527 RepID=A0A4Q2RHX4_9HYPH|nr:MFS transporter [Lichenibacterium ramalinae]RYB07282.1 MFS transporter [Lichenibacterium ramalinae]
MPPSDIPSPRPAIRAAPGPRPALPTGVGRVLLGLSLMLIALNLRAIFPSLSALLPEAMRATGAGPAAASLMTTVPVLCLGLFSPAAAPVARRLGTERAVLLALLAVGAGTALRGIGTVPAILAGGLVAGAGIAFGNVLLPGLVKRDFPDRIALLTGLYSMSLSAGAAVAAALTVPAAQALGSWAAGLAVWALPAGAAALLWLPRALPRRPAARAGGPAGARPLWRDGLAWQVSAFMGLQSALAYCVFGWLAPILRERGLDAASAGLLLSVSVVGQMVGCFAAPALATLGRDQRLASTALYGLVVVGLAGCFYAPLGTAWISAALLGLGQGGLLAVALTMILLRAPDAGVAARLSGMAQGIGYTLAAGGPLLVGVIRQASGGFGAVPILFLALAALGVASGLAAGRARVIDLDSPRAPARTTDGGGA